LDLASPTRGRILAAFTAACLQTHLASRQEKRVIIIIINDAQSAVFTRAASRCETTAVTRERLQWPSAFLTYDFANAGISHISKDLSMSEHPDNLLHQIVPHLQKHPDDDKEDNRKSKIICAVLHSIGIVAAAALLSSGLVNFGSGTARVNPQW
jgi:hypothetical protein